MPAKLIYVISVPESALPSAIISTLFSFGVDKITIHRAKSTAEIKPEHKLEPESKSEPIIKPWKEPPPIVTPDKRSDQQGQLAKWVIAQHPKVIYPDEVKQWLVDKGWSPTSVSVMAYLTKYRIHSNGKGKGYSYMPADH